MSIDRLIAAWPGLPRWKKQAILAVADSRDDAAGETETPSVDWLGDPDSLLSASTIAKRAGLGGRIVRRILQKFRRKNDDGWEELLNPKRRQPHFVYRVGAIALEIERARGRRRPAIGPPRKNAAA